MSALLTIFYEYIFYISYETLYKYVLSVNSNAIDDDDRLSMDILPHTAATICDEWSQASQLLCDEDGRPIFPSETLMENVFETDHHCNSNNASPERR